ncbi:MAG: tRNA (adenosine(37)-N6)-dimethylallyltransferase MiaA [Eubacteriales bacterium]
MSANTIKAVAISGQTASGKSSVSLGLCKEFGGEIISADSMQVYRGMDIGTAKPSKAEQTRFKHHLIDILDIDEPYSLAVFISLAKAALGEIKKAGKTSFVTGGTGLYIERLFCAPADLVDVRDAEIRNWLKNRAEAFGNSSLYDELKKIDPSLAATTHPNNIRRVSRYLELYYATGKTRAELNTFSQGNAAYSPLYIFLYSKDRDYIYSRVNERVEKMFTAGLLDEVETLMRKGLEETPTASAAIGYKELFPYFKGERSLETAKEEIKKSTRNYAKRQTTFFNRFRGRSEVNFIDIKDKNYEDRVFSLVGEYLQTP